MLNRYVVNGFFSPETKLGSKIMRKILNFASFEAKKFSPSFRFKAKITKSKRSAKFKAKKKRKKRQKAKKAKKAKKSKKKQKNILEFRFVSL
jgi:hypothetical protein